MLSDRDLRAALASGDLVVDPPPEDRAVQPASLELRLGTEFAQYAWLHPGGDVDPRNPPPMETTVAVGAFRLCGGGFALAHTVETVGLSARLGAQVDGKSTLGRMGLLVHCTAGYVDPGFVGQITLELVNVGPHAVLLHPGMYVAQLVVHRCESEAERPYGHPALGSRYMGSRGVVEARPLDLQAVRATIPSTK